ncbi:MAG: hypothetical protein HY329_09760 [Chloroflexi bacterium]|nr:hypothetical protein [Chloroflexota bacterium]
MGLQQRLRKLEAALTTADRSPTGCSCIEEPDGSITWWPKQPVPGQRAFDGWCTRATFEAI